MVSLPSSNSTLCSSIPPRNFHKKRGFREVSAWLSFSAPHFSSISRKLFTNGNLVLRKNSLCAKSDDLEIENQQLPTHLTQESGGISRNGGNPSTSFLSFLCPLLKLLSKKFCSRLANPYTNTWFWEETPLEKGIITWRYLIGVSFYYSIMLLPGIGERNYNLEIAASSLGTLARLPWGSRSISRSPDTIDFDPPLRLQLFEFEACPFCRRVREALTELDLSVEPSESCDAIRNKLFGYAVSLSFIIVNLILVLKVRYEIEIQLEELEAKSSEFNTE